MQPKLFRMTNIDVVFPGVQAACSISTNATEPSAEHIPDGPTPLSLQNMDAMIIRSFDSLEHNIFNGARFKEL